MLESLLHLGLELLHQSLHLAFLYHLLQAEVVLGQQQVVLLESSFYRLKLGQEMVYSLEFVEDLPDG